MGENVGKLAKAAYLPAIRPLLFAIIRDMASAHRPWPPKEAELADDLAKVLTVRVGYPLRGKATIEALNAVAARLSDDPTLTSLRQVADAVTVSIGRLAPGSFATATAQVFGLDPDTADMRTVTDRRTKAAITLKVAESALKEDVERRMCILIADDLLKRLPPNSLPPGGYDEPEQTSDEPVSAGLATGLERTSWQPLRRKSALAGLMLLLAITVTLLTTQPWDEAGATTHVELARLTAEAERPLSPHQTPLPGETSPVLGFGDEVGGRRTYQYVNSTPVPDYPILDSFIDSPEHVGDERRFLRVETGSRWYAHRPHWTKPAAIAQSGDLIFVWLYVANDAPQESNCADLVGPTIATNARIRLTVWNSPNNHLHVIRGWIAANNSYPKWITDAAAVITSRPSPLSFDSGDSWQYSITPSEFAKEAPLPNQDFFDAGGMALSSKGLLGSCWANRWAMVFAFYQ